MKKTLNYCQLPITLNISKIILMSRRAVDRRHHHSPQAHTGMAEAGAGEPHTHKKASMLSWPIHHLNSRHPHNTPINTATYRHSSQPMATGDALNPHKSPSQHTTKLITAAAECAVWPVVIASSSASRFVMLTSTKQCIHVFIVYLTSKPIHK